MRALIALCLFAVPAFADGINPITMKIGDAGPISDLQFDDLIITEVGTDYLAIRCKTRAAPNFLFLVRGISTKGLVDDKPWKYAGRYKVADTEKYQGKTVFVLKPDPKN